MSLRLLARGYIIAPARPLAPTACAARPPCAASCLTRRSSWRCGAASQARQGDGDTHRDAALGGGHARIEESIAGTACASVAVGTSLTPARVTCAAAERACDDDAGAVLECAEAWEAVLERRLADADEGADASAPPLASSAPFAAGMQARGIADPLQSVRPAMLPGTLPPSGTTGSLRRAAELERTLRAPQSPPQSPPEASGTRRPAAPPPEELAARVREAVETCETGTTADCAVAWDEVEELSATRDKRKQRDGDKE